MTLSLEKGGSALNAPVQQNWSKNRIRIAAAAVATILAMNNATSGPLTLDDINSFWYRWYVGMDGPGTFSLGASFSDMTYYSPDGTKYTVNGRLTPDSSFNGATDNLFIDVVGIDGNVVGYLTTGFLSNYLQDLDLNPNLRVYTGTDGTRWGISEFDNNGTPYIDMANESLTQFNYRPANIASPVPEPPMASLIGLWLAGVWIATRRRRQSQNDGEAVQAA